VFLNEQLLFSIITEPLLIASPSTAALSQRMPAHVWENLTAAVLQTTINDTLPN